MTTKPPPPDPNLISLSTRDRGSHHPPQPDDWQVVEEALTDWSRDTREWKLNVGDVEAALARLREREQTLEDNRTTWMYRAEKAEAEVARLREREAQLEQKVEVLEIMDMTATSKQWEGYALALKARVARLEEALREIAKGENYDAADYSSLARAALAHEEEK